MDATFHVVNTKGIANPRIYDIAYSHLKGQRPFFPGLQQCHDTGKKLAEEIMHDLRLKNSDPLPKIYNSRFNIWRDRHMTFPFPLAVDRQPLSMKNN